MDNRKKEYRKPDFLAVRFTVKDRVLSSASSNYQDLIFKDKETPVTPLFP